MCFTYLLGFFHLLRHSALHVYTQTGFFPIMHVIAIRREVYEANRWIAMNLFQAFREAQPFPHIVAWPERPNLVT